MPTRNQVPFFILFAAVGALGDFLVSGVVKFIWIAIYAPIHLAAAMTIGSYFLTAQKNRLSILASTAYLVGFVLCHLCLQNHPSQKAFSMQLATPGQEIPVALSSPVFTELLYVTADRVTSVLSSQNIGGSVEMTAALVTDYGCLQSFTVKTVAGVDVESDPEASWTWRITKIGVRQTETPPPLFSNPLPWCQFRFDQNKGL